MSKVLLYAQEQLNLAEKEFSLKQVAHSIQHLCFLGQLFKRMQLLDALKFTLHISSHVLVTFEEHRHAYSVAEY